MAEALELTAAIVKALDKKRGLNIEVLHTTDVTTLADYFIMCSAASTTQLRTLADACEETAKQLGEVPHHVEGERNSGWVLLDYSAVIVHLFLPERPGTDVAGRRAGGYHALPASAGGGVTG